MLFPPNAAVSDYNFGTLIRTNASDEYTQFNTTFGECAGFEALAWSWSIVKERC